MNRLEVENLSKNYGKHRVLKDISLTLTPGIYGVLGRNGAGKTTLFRVLTSVDCMIKGCVKWNDIDSKSQEYAMHVGFLPQNFRGFSDLTVERMLQYFAVLYNIDKKHTEDRITEVLEKVNLEQERKKKLSKLSGGMLRRLGIAQCILHEPEVLVFDEPTAGLDPEERVRFRLLIKDIFKDKIILISSHIVADLEDICQELLVINEGSLVKQGSLADIRKEADGKVYCVGKTQLPDIKGEYTIINEEEESGQEVIRFAAKEQQSFDKAVPTLEDGYICTIKGY